MFYLSPLARNVYILGDGKLFDEIIANMLLSNIDLRVIKRVYVDEATFMIDISWCQPGVILLNETDQFYAERIVSLLPQVSLSEDLRVIAMSLRDNHIKVFDQPVHGWKRGARIPYTLQQITDWLEVFDLIRGKQLLEVADS